MQEKRNNQFLQHELLLQSEKIIQSIITKIKTERPRGQLRQQANSLSFRLYYTGTPDIPNPNQIAIARVRKGRGKIRASSPV